MERADEDDVSARVLLRNVLQTDTQRSPVTRSASRDQQLSRTRRSSRLRNTPETPHVALRNKLKQKLHETAAQSPPPPSKRARSQGRTLKTPAVLPSPALYDDDVTPRGLLRGIIRTEAEASLLLSGQTAVPQGDQLEAETSHHSNRRSDGVSGLELPDLATEPLTHLVRGMSRRRPAPTFNVSAFEKQLGQTSGEEEELAVPQENPDVSKEQDLSAGSKSVLSLTLKTPFVTLPSERAGLRRKASGRRKGVSVDAFDEAIQKRLEAHDLQDYTAVQDGGTLQDSDWHKFTLGLSNVTVPELTTHVMMSNTELYAHPQASELRDADEEEMRDNDGDVGEELQDVVQDELKVRESSVSKPDKDPSEALEPDSRCREEEDDVEMIPPSPEGQGVSLSPEEIPFAPTQAMVERESLPQEQEESESAVQEAQVEEMDQGEGESIQGEELSHLPQRITRRAYHSEGGAIKDGVMARGRGTKSLGMDQALTEKQLQSLAGGTELEEVFSMEEEEEPHRSPASSSAVHAANPETSLTQNVDQEEVHHHGQSEHEEVIVSVHVSPTVNFSASEEEEEQQQEEEEEEEEEQEQEEEAMPEEEDDEQEEEEQQQEVEEEEQDQEQEGVEALQEEEDDEQEEEEQQQEVEEEEQDQEQEEVEALQEEEDEEQEPQQQEFEELQEEEEEEDNQSEELSMQTPGFIRQRKQVSTPGALATPTILKAQNAGPAPKVVKPRSRRAPRSGASAGVLPKSYVMSVFKHFAKTKVASDVYPVISDILQRYFDRLAEDLEVYSAHAKRKTIEVEDVELLMRRQGFVTDSTPLNVLIEKFLPLEYRKLLIPVATSGNKVVPDLRR